MGSRLVPAHPSNPYGHWEDCDFVELDDALLRRTISPLCGDTMCDNSSSGVESCEHIGDGRIPEHVICYEITWN